MNQIYTEASLNSVGSILQREINAIRKSEFISLCRYWLELD
jgi:hypothetical protein